MATINQAEPRQVLQGTTALWQRQLPEYPAPTWTLNYTLIGPERINIVTTPNSGAHEANISPANTANWNAGHYQVYARVSDGTSIFEVNVAQPTLQVILDPITATVPTADVRSWARKTLDLVETALASLAAKTVSSATVNGTTYTLADLDALRRMRASLQAEVLNEETRDDPSRRLIYTRFSTPTW
jgi:hypothetical protein